MYHQLVRKSESSQKDVRSTGSSPSLQTASHPVLQLQQAVGNQAVVQMARGKYTPRSTNTSTKKRKRSAVTRTPRTAKVKLDQVDGIKKRPRRQTARQTSRRSKYTPGMHGYKGKEQKRLSELYDFAVSGKTHESEHTVGYEPLSQTSILSRGGSSEARTLENKAPAYQEVYSLHRRHIGTGTKTKRDKSGFNSREYRDTQRSLIEAGDVSSAVQINQLGYAFDKKKSKLTNTIHGFVANNSYDHMVEHLDSMTYAQGSQEVTVPVDAKQRVEMYLARRAMISGKFPTVDEENQARLKFGLPLYQPKTK